MFRFSQDDKEIADLITGLDKIGLSVSKEKEEYLSLIWLLITKWPSDLDFEIKWLQIWVNDGQDKEDIEIELKHGDKVLLRKDFEKLSLENEGLALRKAITKTILEIFSNETGKHT